MPVSYAYNQVKLFNTQDSVSAIVENSNGVLMLKQDWYGTKYEIDPVKQVGFRKISIVSTEEYKKALKEISFGFDANSIRESVYGDIYSSVSVNVYFVDYKLKDYSNAMALSFKDRSIVVLGTSNKLSKEQIHRLAVHEFAHQIDFQLMDEKKRQQYRKIRGIEDTTVYSDSSSIYINRPQEIFAEDFRLLFGGETSRKILHLNSSLEDPIKIAQLKEFFRSLIPEQSNLINVNC